MGARKTPSLRKRVSRLPSPISDSEWFRGMEGRRVCAEEQMVRAIEMNKRAHEMCDAAVDMRLRNRLVLP